MSIIRAGRTDFMKENLVEIISVHDETAALNDCFQDALNGYKKTLTAMKKIDKEIRLSAYGFGASFKTFFVDTPVEKAKVSVRAMFEPDGVCPMLDSIAKTMDITGERYSSIDSSLHPSQVVFVIVVLGRDNASKKYTYEAVRDMIALQRDVYKWKFYLLTDFSINMEKLGIAEDDTIIIHKSEPKFFTKAYGERSEKLTGLLS